MVVKWIKRWLSQGEENNHRLVSVSRDQHKVSRNGISHNALKVLYRLQNAGHEAYLVGGCVRDLQLGLAPKDFDVATSATPEDTKALFGNSRIIGRRFRIVHVRFGREIIEVTTFRGQANESDDQKQSDEGQLLRDNVYGKLEDDAKRRDFTINAMYYTPKDFVVKAYPQGMQDMEERTIRIIGDPETRYREDPVRMLRAIRFAAKLNFTIETETANPIFECANLLTNVSSARLFDEVLKLLMSGQGVSTWALMRHYNIAQTLLPQTMNACKDYPKMNYDGFIEQAIANTDERINAKKPVTPAFLYAALLWPAVNELAKQTIEQGMPATPAWHKAMSSILEKQVKLIGIPKRFSIPMKEIWEMQLRLPNRRPNRIEQTVTHPRFRAAYDFLLLREQSGENMKGLGQWWTDYQAQNPEIQARMIETAAKEAPRKRRRRAPRKPKAES